MVLDSYIDFNSKVIEEVIIELFDKHDMQITKKHSFEVGDECRRIAQLYDYDVEKAYLAGLIHDIGGIIPASKRVELAIELGIELQVCETQFPLLLHQKFSKVIAKEYLGILDESILSSISCHTTLKKDYRPLDLIVFISDKLKWDRDFKPPFAEKVVEALDISLEHAVFEYMDFTIKNNFHKIIHPDFEEGYKSIAFNIKRNVT